MIFSEENKYKKCIGIYSIRNLINNKIYIGQTTQNFQRRYWHHQWKLKDGSHDNYHLQAAWKKYGEDNFIFEVVRCISEDEIVNINQLEINYIKLWRKKKLCYNISDGGDGTRGVPMSEYAKRIVGEANRKHNIGKKASLETKKKMSNSHKKNGKLIARNRNATILNEDKVKEIKNKLISGISDRQLAIEYNCHINTIRNIKYDNSWADIIVEGWNDYKETIPKRIKTKATKITEEEISEIIKDVKNGIKKRKLEQKYHRCSKTINKILEQNNITW